MDTVESQPGEWAGKPSEELYRLITSQIKTYARRPLIRDAAHLADVASSQHSLASHFGGQDFSWSLYLCPRFYDALCFEGLLPICSRLGGPGGPFVLLPKHHVSRAVLCGSPNSGGGGGGGGGGTSLAHAARHAAKAARKGFRLTVNTAFDSVVAGCVKQHGESWLYPPGKYHSEYDSKYHS
jgi:hypothetical protein